MSLKATFFKLFQDLPGAYRISTISHDQIEESAFEYVICNKTFCWGLNVLTLYVLNF